MRNRFSWLSQVGLCKAGLYRVLILAVVCGGVAGCERKPRVYAGIWPDGGAQAVQADAAPVDPSAHYNDSKLVGGSATK